MNQTLTEHHIAQYNILLIEDQTVNQTKHAWEVGKLHPEELNITFAELNQTVNWTQQLINQTVNKRAPHCMTYKTYTLEQQIAW